MFNRPAPMNRELEENWYYNIPENELFDANTNYFAGVSLQLYGYSCSKEQWQFLYFTSSTFCTTG